MRSPFGRAYVICARADSHPFGPLGRDFKRVFPAGAASASLGSHRKVSGTVSSSSAVDYGQGISSLCILMHSHPAFSSSSPETVILNLSPRTSSVGRTFLPTRSDGISRQALLLALLVNLCRALPLYVRPLVRRYSPS